MDSYLCIQLFRFVQDKIDLKEARKLYTNFVINDFKFYTFTAV